MRKTNLYLIIILSILSCNSISEEHLKERLNNNLEIYCAALYNFDSHQLINYYPLRLIETMGGKEGFKAELENTREEFIDNGFSYKKITFSNPQKFTQNGKYTHSIVPIQTIIYTSDEIVTSNTFLYCFSEDDGINWMIMDYEILKKTFPNFKFEFHPNSESEIISDSCKFVQLDLFGNEMCLDRFIDSGEYEPKRYENRYVYKLVRKDQSINLTKEQFNLIRTSINNWISEVTIECQSPEINEETVIYLESEIGRYYLYDVYGIIFKYNYLGETIQDTLPGSFKQERYISYQSSENIKLATDISNEFEIGYDASEFLGKGVFKGW